MIKVTGNTYQHREEFLKMRGKWDARDKSWRFFDLNTQQINKLKSFVGISVIDTSTKIINILNDIEDDDIIEPIQTNAETKIYGDDDTYFNYFENKNPRAFFGFSNLEKFIDFIEEIPKEIINNPDRNDGFTGNFRFTSTNSMEHALDLAKNGWHEGVEKKDEILDEINIEYAQNKKTINSMVGGSVNIGKMLSGNPLHMRKRKKQPKRRIIKLFVSVGMLAFIKTEIAIIRAITVCAIVDLLELNGYSCEIIAVADKISTNSSRSTIVQFATVIKNAGEKLNLLNVSFTLGHPSFNRRMIFAAVGSSDECKSIWQSQGRTTHAFKKNNQNEFYISHVTPFQQEKLKHLETLKDKALAMLPMIKPDGLPIEINA